MVVDFIVKPFKIRDVKFVIDKVLSQKQMMVENLFLKGEFERKKELEVLNRDLTVKVEEMEKFNFILRKVDWKKSSADLFDQLTSIASQISNSHLSLFHIPDEVSGSLVPISVHSSHDEYQANNIPAFVEEIVLKAVKDKNPVTWQKETEGSLLSNGVNSALAIPLSIKEKVLGALSVCLADKNRRFDDKDLYYLNFIVKRAALVVENTALYENICQNLFATLYAFVQAIEARDPYTKQHSVRVAEISMQVAKYMGCSARELDLLDFAGRLHDIGKIGIRDNILLKNGRLDDEEFTTIKTHPVIGASIVGHLGLLAEETMIIRHHHERWDGNGYPDGLGGDEIPFLSRIMSVADTFDAMTSDRAYRRKLEDSVAFDTVKKNAGSQFDPQVSEAFTQLAEKGLIKSNPL